MKTCLYEMYVAVKRMIDISRCNMHFIKFYSLSSGNVIATNNDSSTDNRSQSYNNNLENNDQICYLQNLYKTNLD